MAWGVALWSIATFLTPWAADRSIWALLAMRVLLGIAEGVALPSMNNMVSRYIFSRDLYVSCDFSSCLYNSFSRLMTDDDQSWL